jgi:N-methylhydantoinase A
MIKIGVDIGGTFTDVVCLKDNKALYSTKVSSTPKDLIEGIVKGVKRTQDIVKFEYNEIERFIHGTTIATNVTLEKKGATVGVLMTEGFRDVLEIGRIHRTEIYNLFIDEQTPTFLAPRRLRFEVKERIDPNGVIIQKLDEIDLIEKLMLMKERFEVESIAVCYLFSYKNPAHEVRTKEIVKDKYPEIAVSLSCEVDPTFREYERLCMTAFDAYVKPKVGRYLAELEGQLKKMGIKVGLQIMQSSGGITSPEVISEKPAVLFLSGPAGGVIGGSFAGRQSGIRDVITLDMGGTSCDVSLVKNGRPLLSREGKIFIYPMRTRMVDVNTIGAGGGSIAWIDAGGGLRVGPQSAGAEPGPACYRSGGKSPTVTDASLVLGYLNPDYFAGGDIILDKRKAMTTIERISKRLGLDISTAAFGIHRIVNSNMANQIRLVSIARGYDPRRFALVLLGGAGPVHGGALIQELGISTAIVPQTPGVLSAFGLLIGDVEHHASKTYLTKANDVNISEIKSIFAEIEAENEMKMKIDKIPLTDINVYRSADMRCVGQSYEIEIPIGLEELNDKSLSEIISGFHDSHKLTYGHSDPSMPIEFVNLRVTHSFSLPEPHLQKTDKGTFSIDDAGKGFRDAFFGKSFGYLKTPIYDRDKLPQGENLNGPVIIEQVDTTTVIYPGQNCHVDESGNIIIEQERGDENRSNHS